jgi:hypothetical protein
MSARKGAMGARKGQKRHCRQVIVATSNDGGNEEDDSDKGYITTAEHNF